MRVNENWRDGREAEGAPLLRAYGVKLIESSNLSFSAMIIFEKAASMKIERLFFFWDSRYAIALIEMLAKLDHGREVAYKRSYYQLILYSD